MSDKVDIRELSRSKITTTKLTDETVTLSALIRIADALEGINLYNAELEKKVKIQSSEISSLKGETSELRRSKTTLKGHLTRYKTANNGN